MNTITLDDKKDTNYFGINDSVILSIKINIHVNIISVYPNHNVLHSIFRKHSIVFYAKQKKR